MSETGRDKLDCRRIVSLEQQLERMQGAGDANSAAVDAEAQQMSLFDARWHGVVQASTADPPADTSLTGRARAVEAYRANRPPAPPVAPEDPQPEDSDETQSPSPEERTGEEADRPENGVEEPQPV